MDNETKLAFAELRTDMQAGFAEARAERQAVSAESQASFARIDRWFELSQQQFQEHRADFLELGEDVRGLSAVVAALSGRVNAMNGRIDRLEQRAERVEAMLAAFIEETRERFIGVDEQFRTLTARLQRFEQRIEDRIDAMSREIGLLREQTQQVDARTRGGMPLA